MTTNSQLRILRKAAPQCQWTHKNGRFEAVMGRCGVRVVFTPGVKNYQIVTKALAVQSELVEANKDPEYWGEKVNAETSSIEPRKTGAVVPANR